MLDITRKRGNREPITIEVTYPEATELASVPILFWMKTTGLGSTKVEGESASAVDVSSGEKTAWQLTYQPAAVDVDTPGEYLCEFEAQFAGDQTRWYPPGSDFVRLHLINH